MLNIRDLHLKNDIIPLFDSVCNEYSRDVLIELLSFPPSTIEEITFRQNIIKGLMEQEHLFFPFFYSRGEFSDVYTYTTDTIAQSASFLESTFGLPIFLSGKKWDQERGMLNQLFIFLRKIEQAYIPRLKAHLYPNDVKDILLDMTNMLGDLEIEKNEAIVRKKGFSRTEVGRLINKLHEKDRKGDTSRFWKAFFLFEAYLSIAKGSIKYKFTFPEFHNFPDAHNEGLSITDFYHPLLKQPVKNSIRVENNVTLITGPNMSGKSTLLKAIGLCVYLAHLGVPIPAEACTLPFFDVISIAIHLNDDIHSGYSHFLSEIKNLKAVVTEASRSKRCFAIFDELFRGTNVEDALVISQKTIEGLTRFQDSYFFISTHLYQLKGSITRNEKISSFFIECNLDNNTPRFTYALREGWSDLKIGQLIFEQEGLNSILSSL